MIVSSDVVRLGFGEFGLDSTTLSDLNLTLDELKAEAHILGELDDDDMMNFAQEMFGVGSSRDVMPSSFDKQVVRNYFLLRACMSGNEHEAEEAIRLGADVNERSLVNGRRSYPLLAAATKGKKKIVKKLVKAGADVNIQQMNGEYPLAIASALNHYEVAEYLLKKHADPNLVAHDGLTSLQVAASDEMRALLLEYGAKS